MRLCLSTFNSTATPLLVFSCGYLREFHTLFFYLSSCLVSRPCFYTILAVGNLVCKITHRMIFRLLCKIVFWNLLKLLFLSLKVLTFQSLSFGRRFKKAFVEALIHASTDEDSESSQNNSSFPSTDDNHRSDEGDPTNQITPLDASVFRPRRRRSRITTPSLRPVDDDRLNSI